MKLKHLVIFGLLLALLGVAVFVKSRQKPAELTTEEYVPLKFSFDSTKVAGIQIAKGKDPKTVELKKNDAGTWVVASFMNARADEKKVQNLFKAITDAKGELRAKDKALLPDFGLSEDKAFRLTFADTQGKTVFALLAGPKIPRYGCAFVRSSDSDQVFFAETELFGQMGIYEDPEKTVPPSDYWTSMALTELKPDPTDGLTIKRFKDGKGMVAAGVRRETDPADLSKKWWKFERPGAPFPPDASKIKEFFKSLSTRPASKALDPKARDYGFSAPKWQMTLHQEDGKEIVITAGAEDPVTKGFYMQVTGEPVVFLFPQYYFNELDVDDSKFFGENPLAVDPETIEKIFIHTPAGEVDIAPKTDKRDAVTRYISNLKGLTVSKLVFDPAVKIRSNSGQLHWIEIKKEGVKETVFLDVEGTPLAGTKEYLAAKRGGTQPFQITETTFKNLFGDIAALRPAAEPAKK